MLGCVHVWRHALIALCNVCVDEVIKSRCMKVNQAVHSWQTASILSWLQSTTTPNHDKHSFECQHSAKDSPPTHWSTFARLSCQKPFLSESSFNEFSALTAEDSNVNRFDFVFFSVTQEEWRGRLWKGQGERNACELFESHSSGAALRLFVDATAHKKALANYNRLANWEQNHWSSKRARNVSTHPSIV